MNPQSYEQYIKRSAVPKWVIDALLDSAQPTWAQFDPELGYTLASSVQHNGLDGCWTISTVQPSGARTAYMHTDRPCRVNTYGNSFAECHQVSDGETWQEYLAAHLGEPIRNFGVGGYGVYQAYRRMLRTEQADDGAPYVLLYIWGDDHQRSAMRCRHAAVYPYWNCAEGMPFHVNFWSNIEMDLGTRQLVEKPSLLPTPETLYRMTSPDFMFEALRDDLMVQLEVADSGSVDPASIDLDPINALAEILGVEGIDPRTPGELRPSVRRIKGAYGFAATKSVLDKAASFCRSNGKELMVLLFCPQAARQLLHGLPRYDQQIVDHLEARGMAYFDMNPVHLNDYQSFNVSVEDYMRRYSIGHYNPAGNHLFAYALKDKMVEWLDPKPVTYRPAE